MQRSNLVVVWAMGVVMGLTMAATAAPLTGSGSNLPLPSSGPPPYEGYAVSGDPVAGPWQGTWSTPAASPWIGTFDVEGPLPSSLANNTGLSRYSFAGLPGGVLPAGTYFFLGDVDGGSATSEQFILNAFNGSGPIATAWLDEPIGVSGTSLPSQMPAWGLSGGTYTFDGSTVTGNPSVGVWLVSNTAITDMTVNRTSGFANFNILAPLIPEPTTLTLLCIGGVAILRRRR